jgi:hypothetical protein
MDLGKSREKTKLAIHLNHERSRSTKEQVLSQGCCHGGIDPDHIYLRGPVETGDSYARASTTTP